MHHSKLAAKVNPARNSVVADRQVTREERGKGDRWDNGQFGGVNLLSITYLATVVSCHYNDNHVPTPYKEISIIFKIWPDTEVVSVDYGQTFVCYTNASDAPYMMLGPSQNATRTRGFWLKLASSNPSLRTCSSAAATTSPSLQIAPSQHIRDNWQRFKFNFIIEQILDNLFDLTLTLSKNDTPSRGQRPSSTHSEHQLRYWRLWGDTSDLVHFCNDPSSCITAAGPCIHPARSHAIRPIYGAFTAQRKLEEYWS